MIRESIQTLIQGISITKDAAGEAMSEIMSGEATDAQIASFATALRMKGETSNEVAGMAATMLEMALTIEGPDDAVDTCGTGGDGSGTFNISTTAAFVLAGGKVPVAKHGNRAVSGSVGSADVLEQLGVRIDLQPDGVQRCIDTTQLCFMFAPIFHPSMRFAANARREIGIRTIFNILGPLVNPARVTRQVIGVADLRLGELIANVQVLLGSSHTMVCHGFDGVDEISLEGPTRIWELKDH
jgi:anthranilate phosphoribosyltransferase